MKHMIMNPILPGYYPDPTICRKGDDFYLACSTLEMYPGIPIFHSKDLAHWEQIGNAMTEQNHYHVKHNSGVGGMMAPTIRYNDGVFYIIANNLCEQGNFIVTAKNPAGPWSEPHWIKDAPGIDASLFFDNDGRAYLMGTGEVWENEGGRMERGIWLAEFDIEKFRFTSDYTTIFNSGLRGGASSEAPHIYHVGDYYHLIIAEGGDKQYHSVMHARSKNLFGFFEGNPANPVMTHRYMGLKSPYFGMGHADLVDLPDGSWAAVLLGTRLIDGKYKNLGRETFYCPVVWENDWPLFSPGNGQIQEMYDAPACLPWIEYPELPTHYDFNEDKREPQWVGTGTPYGTPFSIHDSALYIRCIPQNLNNRIRLLQEESEMANDRFAAVYGLRQTKLNQTATAYMTFMPGEGEEAGLVLIRAMNHQMHLVRTCREGKQLLQMVLTTADFENYPFMPGFSSTNHSTILVECEYPDENIVLQICLEHMKFTIRYGLSKDSLQELTVADGRAVNVEKVGNWSGTIVGMYATANGRESNNQASFDWFEME